MNVEILGCTVEIDDAEIAEPPEEVRRQLREYERGDRRTFELTTPTDGLAGRVRASMAEIPYGETRTYGDLAADNDTAAIAVGRICANNPTPVVVPCHRVVGSDGGLKGYSAPGGVATKRRLLQFEARDGGPATGQARLPTWSAEPDA